MSFYIDSTVLEYDEALMIMIQLKEYYQDLSNDEDERDQCRVMFNEMCLFFAEDIHKDISLNPHRFNIMAPVGGPYYVPRESPIKIKRWLPMVFEATMDGYVGHIHLFSDKCGMNNLKILSSSI